MGELEREVVVVVLAALDRDCRGRLDTCPNRQLFMPHYSLTAQSQPVSRPLPTRPTEMHFSEGAIEYHRCFSDNNI